MVEATQAGNERTSRTGASQSRAGKEVAESSSMGEKHVLAVNLTREWEARRPQFLAVGLFPSVLLVTSKQLIDHMKNEKGMENGVGSKRDGVGG